MLYRQLVDQQSAPPTILNSGAKSPLTEAFVQLAPFLDQTNTIKLPFSYLYVFWNVLYNTQMIFYLCSAPNVIDFTWRTHALDSFS